MRFSALIILRLSVCACLCVSAPIYALLYLFLPLCDVLFFCMMAVGKVGPDGKMGPTLGDCLVQFQVEVDGVVHICEVCIHVGMAQCRFGLIGSVGYV